MDANSLWLGEQITYVLIETNREGLLCIKTP